MSRQRDRHSGQTVEWERQSQRDQDLRDEAEAKAGHSLWTKRDYGDPVIDPEAAFRHMQVDHGLALMPDEGPDWCRAHRLLHEDLARRSMGAMGVTTSHTHIDTTWKPGDYRIGCGTAETPEWIDPGPAPILGMKNAMVRNPALEPDPPRVAALLRIADALERIADGLPRP